DVREEVSGRPHLLYLLPGFLPHEQVCAVCLEIYLPYIIPRVADAHWWTFASCVLETGLGRDQQQFKISCSCVASCFSAVCGYNLCWVQSIVQTGHSCVSHFA
ncbi:transmembrane protein 241, partial [Homo sapiens]